MERPSPPGNGIGSTNGSRWIKRILLAFWACRCILLLSTGIVWVASLVWMDQTFDIPGNILGASIAVILLITLCISLDLVSMILLARHALLPTIFLAFQAVQTMIWSIVLGVEVFVAESLQGSRNFLGWFLSLVVHVMILILFTYACVFHSRARRRPPGAGWKDELGPIPSTLSLAPPAPQHSHDTDADVPHSDIELGTAPPPSYEESQRPPPAARRSFVILALPDEITQPHSVGTNLSWPHRYT